MLEERKRENGKGERESYLLVDSIKTKTIDIARRERFHKRLLINRHSFVFANSFSYACNTLEFSHKSPNGDTYDGKALIEQSN